VAIRALLQAGGIKAEAYHAGKADDKRIKVQNNWRSGNTQVRFCTAPETDFHLVWPAQP